MADSKARFQIRLSLVLLIGFGGLVLLAVATVLALGLWAAQQNTITLLQDKGRRPWRSSSPASLTILNRRNTS